jgi:hypothetical protein
VLEPAVLGNAQRLQCLADWLIVRVVSGSERRAKAALERAGHEVFYPVGRSIKRVPLRYVTIKKRRAKHRILQVDVRNPYPGYVFCRPLGGETWSKRQLKGWAAGAFGDLEGVIGVCMFGDDLALISDWRVELLRIAQDCGDYDRFDPVITLHEFSLAELRYTKAAEKHWSAKPRLVARLDSNRSTIHYVEEFGRITRVVAAAGDQHNSPIVDATAPRPESRKVVAAPGS